MGKRWALWGGIALGIFVIAGAGITWWLIGGSASAGESHAPIGDAAEAAAALQLLTTDPAALVPDALAGSLDGDPSDAVPEGTIVLADPEDWRPSSAGGGVITVTLEFPDGSTEVLDAVMIEEDDGWKVLQTLPTGELR